MKFEYLPHTADLKIKATGKDLAEAFGQAALAVYNKIADISLIKAEERGEFDIEAESQKALLYDFIDELLFAMDTKKFLGCRIEEIEIREKNERFRLHAVLLGDDYSNYDTHGDIKAMTYNDMEIKQNKETEIIFVVDV